MMEQNEWESLSPEEKRVQLYLKQKQCWKPFLNGEQSQKHSLIRASEI